jgi:transposase
MARSYLPYDANTGVLFPRRLDELVTGDDPVRMVLEATESLNVSPFEPTGRPSGQQPYHPLLMVRLLIWGYANGIYSSRKIATAVTRDVTFMLLAGDCRPSYRALSRFRCDHHKALGAIFEQVFRLCAAIGLVRLGHVALDGTVLKANTSKHKAMSYGRMKKDELRLRGEIDGLLSRAAQADADDDARFGTDDDGTSLPEELHRRETRLEKIRQARERIEQEARDEQKIADDAKPAVEDKEQRSFADPEARIMPSKKGGFEYSYNAQIAVDDQTQVIVAAELDNRSPDVEHLVEMVEAVRDARTALGEGVPETTKTTADAGYFSSEAIAEADGDGIELFVNPGREGKDSEALTDGKLFDVSHFAYDADQKRFTCPQGRLLVLTDASDEHFVAENCDDCPLRTKCLKPSESRRHLRLFKRRVAGATMRTKMRQPAAQEIYRLRKSTVEPVFGQMKWDRGLRGLSMRGLAKSRSEFRFVCAVHNLLKWVVAKLTRAAAPSLVAA